ncbi:hypothetical protein IMZ48_49515 [Candidatus Bathyarchaeota archaeon]|nr:hypothetical protein [Candidatus Bathyarchaeota archaeon]
MPTAYAPHAAPAAAARIDTRRGKSDCLSRPPASSHPPPFVIAPISTITTPKQQPPISKATLRAPGSHDSTRKHNFPHPRSRTVVAMCTPDVFLGVLAILFPPLPGNTAFPASCDDTPLPHDR